MALETMGCVGGRSGAYKWNDRSIIHDYSIKFVVGEPSYMRTPILLRS